MIRIFAALLSLVLVLGSSSAHAGDKAEILLVPTRVIMENADKYSLVQLKNTGGATGEFAVDLIDMEMKEDGNVVPIESGAPTPFSAIPYLHVSPKSMTIRAGESQNIRIMLKKNTEMEAGEYRAHLRVRIANDNVDGTETASKETAPVIAVKANLVLIIPVIVRVGETNYTMGIDTPKVAKDGQGHSNLELYLTREGNRSSMGDFSITYKSPTGDESLLSFFPGVPVYRPTARRFVSIPLEVPAGADLTKGSIDITYSAQEPEGGKILAQKSLTLP